MTTPEVNGLKKRGYSPSDYYNRNGVLKNCVETLHSGIDGTQFPNIYHSLRFDDPYMVLADFEAYCKAQEKASALYRDSMRWQKMSLHNIAASGYFCADRAILEYAQKIWSLK